MTRQPLDTARMDAAARRPGYRPLAIALLPIALALSFVTARAQMAPGATRPRVVSTPTEVPLEGGGVALSRPEPWSPRTVRRTNRLDDLASINGTCPCTIFQPSDVPGNPLENDGQSIELGMKFRSSASGYVKGLRFYKGAGNAGPHVGHLWSSAGTMLVEATFTNETASGWQEVDLPSAIPIAANQTYIVSYHTPGSYAADEGYFTSAVVNGSLQGLADGTDGPNGVYVYSGSAAFPTSSFNQSNYWVDIVFDTQSGPDTTPPQVSLVDPANGTAGAQPSVIVSATFNEPLNPSTVTSGTFQLLGPGASVVPATVTYNAATHVATLDPNASLAGSTTYTARLIGGTSGTRITDLAGNALASTYSWSFTTAFPPDQGPGGPILVISTSSNPFSRYPVELLRAEGLNEFTAMDLASVTPAILSQYDVVVLGQTAVSGANVTALTNWVNAGGTLIAFRPDKQLAGLMGLSDAASTASNGYLQVNTATGAGVGIVGQTMQFHGTADLYNLAGATSVATLYLDATTPTTNPAVSQRSVGPNGGRAVAFTFDLARSVIYTRQGNPAWAGQKRDGQIQPNRSDDMFFGNAASDPQPDWCDFNKIAIPQADEQQRLLANLILQGNLHRKPLPRFWYLPRGLKAAVVMTGDDHANGGTIGRFNQYLNDSPSNSAQAVADWTAVRATSYVYNGEPMSDAQASAFEAQGFEVSLHLNTGCANWTPSLLESDFQSQLATFAAQFPSVSTPTTHRTHCIAWSDWATQPKTELAHGIRLDCNYYYWPDVWIQNRPGLFTGSGIPMRFADLDGSLIDCYQVTTQMPDESGETFPSFIDSLLTRALDTRGYYGVFCANMHTDNASSPGSDAIVASAQSRQVPVVSSRQMLQWLDGRGSSSFGAMVWSAGALSFNVSVGEGARNLQGMVPLQSPAGTLTSLTGPGGPIAFTVQTIKGMDYAFFPATAGAYVASYVVDTTPPQISGIVATPHADGTATIQWNTDELADSRVDYGTSAGSLNQNVSDGTAVTSHSMTISGLASGITIYYRVTSKDRSNNSSTSPNPPASPLSFQTPSSACPADRTAGDFGAGTTGTNTIITQVGDGEVVLTPAIDAEFSGTAVPGTWQALPWGSGSTIAVGGGLLTLNNARAATNAAFGPGSSVEFVATFGAEHFQHVGFVTDMSFDAPWAIFSTATAANGVYARTDDGTSILLPGSLLGSPHRYRIDWQASSFVYSVDGTVVATIPHAVASNMLALASDIDAAATTLTLDWLRVTPYATSGSFVSRVFDGGGATSWGAASWTAATPTGTALALLARQGNTPTPDGTWTAFTAIPGSGSTVGGSSRYIQYRADLSTTNSAQTPSLQDMSIACVTCGDPTPPVAITNLSITRATTGAHDGQTPLLVAFTKPANAATVQVYRAPFGGYPRYDEAGGSTPSTPAYPPGAPWVLTPVTAPGQTDDPPSRDVWHYVVFSTNTCGISSAASNRPAGIPNYYLGDVTDGIGPCRGDGLVNTLDLSLLGAHYGQTLTGTEPWACLDMGPTVDGSPDTRPVTDGAIEFEDLIILAMSLSDAAPPTASLHLMGADHDRLTVTAPAHVEAGDQFTATLQMSGTGAVRGLSAQLVWDPAIVTPQSAVAGAMLSAAGGMMYSPKPGRVDAVTTGSRFGGLTGDGVVATVTFRANASGNPAIAFGRVDARDGRNQPVDMGQGLGTSTRPATTAFGPIVPNPVSDQAMMSFTLSTDGPVELSLYSVDGRRVANLIHETRAAGVYHVPWDGRSVTGGRLPQGLYYARLVTPQGRFTRSVIVVR
jgi:Domain of unknown function (DUF4082)/Bacterial Ig-like domain/Cohesin domain